MHNSKIKVLGLIPARGGSKTIRNKNIVRLNDKPLIYYTIKESLKSKLITKLIVSTDNKNIAKISNAYGAEIPFIRPNKLSLNASDDSMVINHTYNFFKKKNINFDYIVYLRPTSPFRKTNIIDTCIKKVLNDNEITSLRTISKVQASDHPYWTLKIDRKKILPFIKNHNYHHYKRKQLLPHCYKLSGMVDVINTKYCNKINIYGNNIGYHILKGLDIDIDNYDDLKIAELLFKKIKHFN